MSTYKHPGVYVEEISTLPPSVAEVSTAVPAFIGYTERASDEDGADLTLTPTRISTFLEYQTYFGGAQSIGFSIDTTEVVENNNVVDIIINNVTQDGTLTRYMHHGVDLYFKNGGGPCYIVSVGSYGDEVDLGDDTSGLLGGVKTLEKKDEPTLIVIPDAVALVDIAAVENAQDESAVNAACGDYYALYAAVLAQCEKLGDRFGILDVLNLNSPEMSDEANFRDNIGTNSLKYGAAYYPYLQTSLNYAYREDEITVSGISVTQGYYDTDVNGIRITYNGDKEADSPTVAVELLANTSGAENIDFTVSGVALTIRVPDGDGGTAGSTPTQIRDAWDAWKEDNNPGDFEIDRIGTYSIRVDTAASLTSADFTSATDTATLESLKTDYTSLYNTIKTELARQRITLPPGTAIAGIYAKVDRERGVWKAPANVSLASVIEPVIRISDADQGELNVDPNGGKSINCIRKFQGKGNMVWGARTLAGNDNEWRYVSVRRLFNTIEESVKKATAFAVFEPNDIQTWQKVKGLIQGYLYQLWQRGALAGSSAETSYFVHVGLGTTMGTQDILEGRMIVEIGIAAVRPAEFIILRFSHKLQEN